MDHDLVVIGAGIHGAGVAQAAAASGYRVLVLEQYEKAAQGTSSRSSKLIHGGLRYLETGQLGLVYECLRERAQLLRNAPHLVELVPFYIPVYRTTRRRPWKIAVGLALYSLLSLKPFHRIPRGRWQELEGLRTDGLDAVFSYYDAQTDDARLTRSVLQSARDLGAEVVMGAHFESATIEPDGCTLTFRKRQVEHQISTRVLINCAGPWASRVLEKITPHPTPQPVDLVQGTHILVPGKLQQMYYLESPTDQRAVFVMPWKGQRLIGTTETPYRGDPADVRPLESEISYLLEVHNHYFTPHIEPDDVIDSFAGLRVLPIDDEKAFARSREILMIEDDRENPRVVNLYGGKLTAFRASAETLIEQLEKTLPPASPIANTRTLKLPEVD